MQKNPAKTSSQPKCGSIFEAVVYQSAQTKLGLFTIRCRTGGHREAAKEGV